MENTSSARSVENKKMCRRRKYSNNNNNNNGIKVKDKYYEHQPSTKNDEAFIFWDLPFKADIVVKD